jgi:hypothetical protein
MNLESFRAMPSSRKQVVTMMIGDFAPLTTRITLPSIRSWARKIGAEFHVIDQAVFHRPSVTYEKFQLYRLSRGYDWTIFIDADALVHPDTPDWSEMVTRDQVVFHALDMRLNRFRAGPYLRRARCLAGACTWLTMFSDCCRDLWHPLDEEETSWEECVASIQPTAAERASGHCPAEHLIDDYLVSENVCRYGLKATTVVDLCRQAGIPAGYYWHLYMTDPTTKAREIMRKACEWGIWP